MCASCGCGGGGLHDAAGPHAHEHGAHGLESRRVAVEQSLLADNRARAARLARSLAGRGIDCIGLLGGPGVGKTALLEASFERMGESVADREAVIEGDCATDFDARRIAARGARVTQVMTGSLCHLDAHLVEHALESLDLTGVARLWIENVGNLVCPAAFGCGESRRAVLVSAADGDDKPEKYPAIFAAADLLVITKSDLLPHVDFDVERCVRSARRVRPGIDWICLSARSGENLDRWLEWAGKGNR